MTLSDGYTDVPAGKIAAIVTCLQMFGPPAHCPETVNPCWTLTRRDRPDLNWYRDLFRRVGEQWLWYSRLRLPDDALRKILHDPDVQVYVFRSNDCEAGLLELDFRRPDECELAFIGLMNAHIGQGAGRWLMNRAIELAWSQPIQRFWLHTCSLDHPAALAFYQRSGFIAFRRQIEIADDPRLTGILSRSSSSEIPLL